VAGHIEFYSEIYDAGLKPILGIETYQTTGSRQTNKGDRSDRKTKERMDNFHLILLAMNERGLRNLYAMNSEAHTTGFYYNGRVDWDLLRKYNEGIICTSACGLSLTSQALRNNPYAGDVEDVIAKYLDIFGDRFYIELSTYSEQWSQNLNQQLIDVAQYFSIPLVYANDAHYAFPEQYKLHETVLCMQYGEKVSQRTEPHHCPDLFIMSEQEINERMYYLPQSVIDESIDTSDEIAKRCNVKLPESRKRIPVFVPDSKWATAREMLYDLAVEGYQRLIIDKGLDNEVYMERFKMEMNAIFKADLVDYLLIVRDYIIEGKKHGLVGPGRGSVGGSLVAYCLDIHQLDPIKYGLMFERFYNIGREGKMPDIDTDFPTWVRDIVNSYIGKKYGASYVAPIGTVSTLQPRAAISKIGITTEVPFMETKAINKVIERCIESGQQPKWRDIYKKAGDDIAPFKMHNPQLFDYAEKLERHIFTYGVHPSGILVGDEPLAEVFPLRWHAKDKKVVTQWDMRTAEKFGFMKMDILGVRNLDGLMEYCALRNEPWEIFYDVVNQENNLPDDMWQFLEDGRTVGIFQIEDGPDANSLCKKIKPRNLEDIALITALNRPGPLKSGSHLRYIRGRNGEPVVYRHPIYEKIAQETYGEIIYQEQFIQFFVELGYTPVEADLIRDIVGKKKRDKMAEIRPDFIKRFANHPGTALVKGVHLDTRFDVDMLASTIWSELENFADYAFNKAHSVGYGLITLWTLWAKWRDPQAFYLGAMKSLVKEGKKPEIPRYIREAQRANIKVLKPDINKSKEHTAIDGNAIRYGFADVKGVGLAPAKWLVKHQPYKDFAELEEKSNDEATKITLANGSRKKGINIGQINALRELTESNEDEMPEVEEKYLGIAISDPAVEILNEYADEIADECVPIEATDDVGTYTIAGVITEIKHAVTRQGKPMAWVTIEHNGVSKSIAVWNTELERLSFIWRRRQALVAHIKVTDRGCNILSARALYTKKSKVEYATD
jgi:DNA polymerase-3 subunit alpha